MTEIDKVLIRARQDPLLLAKILWPKTVQERGVTFYGKQREIIKSVFFESTETVVPAGNMLGKDYVAGFIALAFFLVHREVRVITTSIKDDHLRVLWGEIGRFIQTSKVPLLVEDGGPLIWNHRDIRKMISYGKDDGKRDLMKRCEISYLRGMVSEGAEGMSGHHAADTLAILDEASGIENSTYNAICTWSKRRLIIGNPNETPVTQFFRAAVKGGDLLATAG